MNRSSWLAVPLIAVATSLQAQYTPAQRAQYEAAAQATTIGRTREIEADDRALHDPLRGLRCPNDRSQYEGCAGTWSTYRAGRAMNDSAPDWIRRATAAPIHFAAFGDGPQRFGTVHTLGALPVTIPAARQTTLTLISTIGAPKRHLMVHTAIGGPGAEPDWTQTAELVGDPQGRYLVRVPSFAAGTYELTVEIYDLDRPITPFSASRTPLIVR